MTDCVQPLPSFQNASSSSPSTEDVPEKDQEFVVIECGILSDDGQVRQYRRFCEFFGEEVEVFTAASDPKKHTLYRATLLSKLLGFENNKVRRCSPILSTLY
eukprot:TRINITY_DN1050_c0_g1_i3.p2 TRINITY_DN1050_c0_g1~~TRINITY_DN1050_c0_g1_i3.p2  ORF type:complete len:102 (-),score=22.17 TRINITY_DN1050_c0_g1_i3:751-1056(-)